MAETPGVPQEAIGEFSQRRAAILTLLHERGQTSRAAAQSATLETRPAEPAGISAEDLRVDWQRRAHALALTPQRLSAVQGRSSWQPPSFDQLQAVAERLVSEWGLTMHASTFTGRDVLRGWCEQLPAGADIAHQRAVTDWLLDRATRAVVPLDHPQRRADQGDGVDEAERRYSTPNSSPSKQRRSPASSDASTSAWPSPKRQLWSRRSPRVHRSPMNSRPWCAASRSTAPASRSWWARPAGARPSRWTLPAPPGTPPASRCTGALWPPAPPPNSKPAPAPPPRP